MRKQDTARAGEMVVALVGDEATVKWYRPGKTSVVLAPDNPDFEPIEVTRLSPELRIAGKVVGVLRRFE